MFDEIVALDIFQIAEQGRKGLVEFIAKEANWPHDVNDKANPIRWRIVGHTIGQVEIRVRDSEALNVSVDHP